MRREIAALIRKDKECEEHESFALLQAELGRAFAAPDESYVTLTAAHFISRN